jgi:cation diffusion facilitator CzcD-associated flavoprotein CzcO
MANGMTTTPKKILVLGAGCGGLTFCQTFRHANASVTVGARIIIGDAAGRTPDGARVVPNHHSGAPREPQLEAPARDLRQSA